LKLSFSPSTPENNRILPRRPRRSGRTAGIVLMKANSSPNAGLRLFTSNRLETLAGKLAQALRRPLASPFQAEVVVVRNKGMERWLRLELARRHGISANQRFPFPEAFSHELFRAVIPGLQENAPLDRETLTWRVMKALPELLPQPGFGSLVHYLHQERSSSDPPDERKRLQLSARIANLFDQYLVFRPDMMLDWDAGGGEGWQAELWRVVSADSQDTHTATLWKRFHETLAQPSTRLDALPERLSIFGVSALPPFYLGLFAALAQRVEVNLFLLQPSQEYWGDITSAREGERILRRQLRRGDAPFQLRLEPGNRLLASMGYLGRDFLKLILDAGDWLSDEDFTEPGEDSLLHTIQSDIVHLRDRGKDPDCPRHAVATHDDSVQVHSCHSPLREMEILYDHLLDWFQRDPSLTPRDIVVMTPDIEAYAPFVQAVFGAPEDKHQEIPFSLADRGARRQSHVIDTFLQILDLPDTRLGAATMLALLEAEAVRAKFSLSEADLENIRGWAEQTNIRWGKDDEHRAQLGLPKLPGNTWRAGLDRLLLGYSLAARGERMFGEILPYDDIEGDVAAVLGHFVEFAERVFATVNELGEKRPLEAWTSTFGAILDCFFQTSDSAEHELQTIRDALQDLRRQRTLSGFDEAVDLAVVLERLRPALEEDCFGSGFLTGGVTFCGLKPMRSIPFRAVCLVGMNDGAFPRTTRHLSFDLMAKAPRLGDRSTREDDRYLFLETLLSARDRLYFSYVGQSVRDNKQAPPSVLVSELLDYIEQGFTLDAQPDGQHWREHLVIQQRLQAFNEDYFRAGSRLFSYSAVNCRASEFTRQPRRGSVIFVPKALSEPEAEFRHVTLDHLANFLANPAKFFLNRRLGIFLPQGEAELEEREPFVLDGLAGYWLRQELLERLRANEPLASVRHLKQASGDLPLGTVGEADYRRASARAEAFFQLLAARHLLDWIEPLDVDLALDAFRLTGHVAPRTRTGPLLYRCARLKAKDVLRAWVHHLAANTLTPDVQTTLVAEDEVRQFCAVADPCGELKKLLDLYWRGLTEPLKFFPESALAYGQAEFNRENNQNIRHNSKPPIEKAREKWQGNDYSQVKPEAQEPHFELCFRGVNPLDETFEDLARQILESLLRSQTREEL
jgi:exodeoxyribonuclease V gamma subunit